MASRLLPSHTLPCLPTTTAWLSARRPRLALLPAFSSFPTSSSLASPFTSTSLSFTMTTVSDALAGRRRSGILAVPRAAAEGAQPAEAPENDDAAGEEDAGLSEEEEVQPPRKPVVKLGDIMGILHKRAIEASVKERPVPDIRTGDIVEIKLEVPENRRRASIYKGIVMSKQNAGIHTTIRIRRIVAGIGVEIVFPVHSPNIKEIKVVKHRKVRRARLYYLREKLPRLSTFK